jgi:hypothetical protein
MSNDRAAVRRDPRLDFVYITSASFSGSTLLTFLLNTHPRIATIGEMKGAPMDVETYCCSCGEPIGHCRFWQRLVARIREWGIPFDLLDMWTQSGFRIPGAPLANRIISHRHRSWPLELFRDAFLAISPACRRAFERFVRTNEIFVQAATELTGCPIFVDASKDAIRLKYLRRIDSFRTKVIYLVRDGRGVMLSNAKHLGMSPEVAAREWVSAQREISCALKAFAPPSRMLIRYEDLCRDPRGEMARAFQFIGVAPEEAGTDFRALEHHILGNVMRLDNRSEIQLDVRWRNELGPAELAIFERIGGRWNRKLGYDAESPAGPAAQPRSARSKSSGRRGSRDENGPMCETERDP